MQSKFASAVCLLALVTFHPSSAFFTPVSARVPSSSLRTTAITQDTPETLPVFENSEKYVEYLKSVSALPKGFATGTGQGKFVSPEAPSMGELPIRGTIIQMTEGPTESWAACFTSNKVSLFSLFAFVATKTGTDRHTWCVFVDKFIVSWCSRQGWPKATRRRWSSPSFGHQQQGFQCLFWWRW